MRDEEKRHKARNMRYKKPIVRDLNHDSIVEYVYEIGSECEDVEALFWDDDEALIDALDGDEEEAFEFKMMFSDLSADCDRLTEDLNEEWVPDCFDRFFVAAGAGPSFGGLLGYDAYEGDYYGLSSGFEEELAGKSADEALMRMTKHELIAAAKQCFRVYQGYIGLRYRYDCLKSSLDILRDKNIGLMQTIRQINETYERANAESDGFKYPWYESVKELDRLIDRMPSEIWLN